jgi:hypothetical protein
MAYIRLFTICYFTGIIKIGNLLQSCASNTFTCILSALGNVKRIDFAISCQVCVSKCNGRNKEENEIYVPVGI